MCELDVFVGNFAAIDWDMYNLWLKGLSSGETVAFLKESPTALKDCQGFSDDDLVSDVNDNYRNFSMLETAILNNSSLSHDCFSQFQLLGSETRSSLIESYYSLDSELCREMVGRKLNSRLRKDLEEFCEKQGGPKSVRLRSARRQFDNVKRVFKTIEEVPGDYADNIEKFFGLSRALTEKYAALVFASSFRFEVSKKKLNYLTFEDVMAVALIIIGSWIDCTVKSADGEEPCDPSLDRDHLSSLRDLRTLQDRDKEHRAAVCNRLKSRIGDRKKCIDFENAFRNVSRGIINVAVGLSHSKDLKDFFVQVVEKVVEPLKAVGATKRDVEVFLDEYKMSITGSGESDADATLLVDNELRLLFSRFMTTLNPAVVALYPE